MEFSQFLDDIVIDSIDCHPGRPIFSLSSSVWVLSNSTLWTIKPASCLRIACIWTVIHRAIRRTRELDLDCWRRLGSEPYYGSMSRKRLALVKTKSDNPEKGGG